MIGPTEISLIVGFVGCGLHSLAVPLALRFTPGIAPVICHAAVFLVLHILTTLAGMVLWPPFSYWHGATVFGAYAVVYLFVFSAVYKSISLALMDNLSVDPDRPVSLDEVVQRHIMPTFDDRIDVLIAMGYIMRDGDAYRITPRGEVMARRFIALQALFGIESSGLYGHGKSLERS